MTKRRALFAGLLASLAVVAGCGGSAGGGATPDGASITPANVPVFITLDTSFTSPQWQRALALVQKFPGGANALAKLQLQIANKGVDFASDVKPALGPEVDLAWLDFENEGHDLVAMTKPAVPAKLDALLAKSDDPPAKTVIDGWTVISEEGATLERFQQQMEANGSLDGNSAFDDAYDNLPEGALARAYVSGDALTARAEQALSQSTATGFDPTSIAGKLDSLSAALIPGEQGMKLTFAASGDLNGPSSTFEPTLPEALPAGALVYAGFTHIDGFARKALERAETLNPAVDQQLAQIETAGGFSFDKDVFPLFSGEGGFALYLPSTSTTTPSLAFVIKVEDEESANRVVQGIVRLVRLSGRAQVTTAQVGDAQVATISLPKQPAVQLAVFDGKLVITSSTSVIPGMMGSGPKLVDDPVYSSTVAAAGLPGETSGFLYADLGSTVKYGITYRELFSDETVSPEVKANTAPLGGLLLYATKEGSNFVFTGFLGVK